MNAAASRLFVLFADVANASLAILQNALVATRHPAGLRTSIVSFDDIAPLLLDRVRRESARFADDPALGRLQEKIVRIPDLLAPPPASRTTDGPFLTVHLRRGDVEARLFTTITTIGTPIDATAEDLQIETYFPADEPTEKLARVA